MAQKREKENFKRQKKKAQTKLVIEVEIDSWMGRSTIQGSTIPNSSCNLHQVLQQEQAGGGGNDPNKSAAGRYSTATQLVEDAQCTVCDAGYYCNTAGLDDPEGACQVHWKFRKSVYFLIVDGAKRKP